MNAVMPFAPPSGSVRAKRSAYCDTSPWESQSFVPSMTQPPLPSGFGVALHRSDPASEPASASERA